MQFPACGDAQLLLHDIHARDRLGNSVFHLQAGIDFQEVEVTFVIQQEFNCASADVADRLAKSLGGQTDTLPQILVHRPRGRLLDQLLMPSLDGALALPQVNDVAMIIAQQLNLNVASPLHHALQIDLAVAEGRLRLPSGRGYGCRQFCPRSGRTDTHPPPTGSRLQHHRIAHLVGSNQQPRVVESLRRTLDDRNALIAGDPARRDLVSQYLQRLRPRPDKRQAGVSTGPGKSRRLGQESVARVNGTCPRLQRNLDDVLAAEVTLLGRRWPDKMRFVGIPHVRRIPVCLGEHSHRLQPKLLAGPKHADCDLTPVRYKDFTGHR